MRPNIVAQSEIIIDAKQEKLSSQHWIYSMYAAVSQKLLSYFKLVKDSHLNVIKLAVLNLKLNCVCVYVLNYRKVSSLFSLSLVIPWENGRERVASVFNLCSLPAALSKACHLLALVAHVVFSVCTRRGKSL